MSEDGPDRKQSSIRLTDAQRLAWLRLIRSENIGPATFRSLVNHYGSATEALEALPELSRRGGAKRRIRICSQIDAEDELDRCNALGARFVALGEPDYPRLLRFIDAPPPLLAVIGDATPLAGNAVAIVGARNASIAGCKIAAKLAGELAAADLVIVSGLARGIDTAAHKASIETGTVAVLAGGLDHIYPPENEDLYRAIVNAGGAIVSEMPFGWAPRARDFPRRNRLISGLSYGVVVVEASRRSGALHTARFALEQGREVFAAPGSMLDPRTEGCNRLIKDGATMVLSVGDILTALSPVIDSGGPAFDTSVEEPGSDTPFPISEPDDATRQQIVDALGTTPVTVDDIVRHTGLSVAAVRIVLIELEVAGRLERHGAQKVSLVY
ncbi:DNA processing protein [Rhodobium orientis]|uniref:DNA-protecting protein DprA n=1 Tax=Rhodobium orientis TaxID=34017 RepID=A0A327JKV0_9HYPH|nr:DNA-processing protein DprA [Rhodobium orientis]MBB4301499.1 DNA processing protein [Rhodobium orientis]MBK5952196.1 DNA protecting protein DprA [Rhodobium orientis]RAI25462.1 DNA-protecting protein DprA [Rhodobium orientis]